MRPDTDTHTTILNSYASSFSDYERFAKDLKTLLETLLPVNGIRFSVIEQRAKAIASLEEKLKRKAYSELTDIPDLAGVRVIVYEEEDLKRAVEVIQSEFEVDGDASTDAATKLAPHEFGYRSVHQVVRLSPARLKLPEWMHAKRCHAEIQIRTVVQHAWAAMSHSLQYKKDDDIPNTLRRRLYRVAALLELADQEFATLTREHKELVHSPDPKASDDLNVLLKVLATSSHSFEWIRSHTPLDYSDEQFKAMIKGNSGVLRSVNIVKHSSDGKRVIPGKPGIGLVSAGLPESQNRLVDPHRKKKKIKIKAPSK